MFDTLFYEPVYNILLFFLNIIPSKDVGIAIILTTILIKFILLPLNIKAQKSQYLMREISGELNDLRDKYKSGKYDHKKYGEETLKLYKEKKINPFASILLVIIQIPIFLALFFVFNHKIVLEEEHIYSFIKFPEYINNIAFGFLNVNSNYWWIGILVGLSMYFYTKKQVDTMNRISEVFKKKNEKLNKNKKKEENKAEVFTEAFMKNMNFQMVYFFPFISGLVSAFLPSALGVYWIILNILNIFQDIYIKKKLDIEGFIKKHSV